MAEPVEPRTLPEAMVRQRQLSWDEAASLVVKTAKQHENRSLSLSGRHLGRLAAVNEPGTAPNSLRPAWRYLCAAGRQHSHCRAVRQRGWAALGNGEQARNAIERTENAGNQVHPDELDEMGGIATFSRHRQLYFSADALVWPPDQYSATEDYASPAVEAYSDPADPDRAFGDAAGSHTALAIAWPLSGRSTIRGAGLTNFKPIRNRISGL